MAESLLPFLENPISVVERLFEQKRVAQQLEGFEAHLESTFNETFSTEEHLDAIPSLNDSYFESLPNGGLVRFRGMIQNMFEPEYFPSVFELKRSSAEPHFHCGFFRDSLFLKDEIPDFNSPSCQTSSRHPLLSISIPGETEWAREAYRRRTGGETREGKRSTKRGFEDLEGGGEGRQGKEGSSSSSASFDMEVSPKKPAGKLGAAAKQRTLDYDPSKEAFSNEQMGNLSAKGVNCIVKIYKDEHGLSLNEEVEFFGILNYDVPDASEAQADQPESEGMEGFEEEGFLYTIPQYSRLPRIHVISLRKSDHLKNPLLPRIPSQDSQLASSIFNSNLALLRSQLILYLGSFLQGDSLAAEAVLLGLLSSVFSRDRDLCVGKFSVNISNCPPFPSTPRPSTPPSVLGARFSEEANMTFSSSSSSSSPLSHQSPSNPFVEQFSGVLSNLVPKSTLIPLGLQKMNNENFRPSKDYKTLHLKSSELQISSGTVLVLDETAMKEGNLNAQGVRNIQALSQLITSQTVQYEFELYPLEFQADAPIIVFSEGRSLFKTDYWVPLEPLKLPNSSAAPLNFTYSPEILNQFRLYLSLARQIHHEIGAEMAKVVEQTFVRMRQEAHAKGEQKMTQEELLSLLSVSRLVSISFGEKILNKDCWEYSLSLETKRRQRIKDFPPRK